MPLPTMLKPGLNVTAVAPQSNSRAGAAQTPRSLKYTGGTGGDGGNGGRDGDHSGIGGQGGTGEGGLISSEFAGFYDHLDVNGGTGGKGGRGGQKGGDGGTGKATTIGEMLVSESRGPLKNPNAKLQDCAALNKQLRDRLVNDGYETIGALRQSQISDLKEAGQRRQGRASLSRCLEPIYLQICLPPLPVPGLPLPENPPIPAHLIASGRRAEVKLRFVRLTVEGPDDAILEAAEVQLCVAVWRGHGRECGCGRGRATKRVPRPASLLL
ncbi:hypothetical protein GGX14DRAFT_627834 [Mycena pura]|uniref:Uncharacterized protein n=1 Tax=Mycena pura TaxID=153505 RepID=A0AAD6YR91_9AGAR|nr:hypothetical protein GGX14DRAFT_627834 [Mycena pura]